MNEKLKYTLANDGQFDPCIMDSHDIVVAYDRMGYDLRNNKVDLIGAVHKNYRFYTRRMGCLVRSLSDLLEAFMTSHNLNPDQFIPSITDKGYPILEDPHELVHYPHMRYFASYEAEKTYYATHCSPNRYADYDAYGMRTEIPLYIKAYAYEYFELLIDLSDNYLAVPAKQFFAKKDVIPEECYVIGDIGHKNYKMDDAITSNSTTPVDLSRLAKKFMRYMDSLGNPSDIETFINTFVFKVIKESSDTDKLMLELPHPLNKLYTTKFQISTNCVNGIKIPEDSLEPFSFTILMPLTK